MIIKLQLKFVKILFAAFGMFLMAGTAVAQEFNCSVTVNDRQISGSSYDYVSELPGVIEDYLNNNRWTNDRFEENERIICNIQIVLTNVDSQFNFTAETVFTMRRPIYNTNQQSMNIVLSDNNWRFHYPRNKNLIHDDLQFDDLTSFLDFYAYIMLGLIMIPFLSWVETAILTVLRMCLSWDKIPEFRGGGVPLVHKEIGLD